MGFTWSAYARNRALPRRLRRSAPPGRAAFRTAAFPSPPWGRRSRGPRRARGLRGRDARPPARADPRGQRPARRLRWLRPGLRRRAGDRGRAGSRPPRRPPPVAVIAEIGVAEPGGDPSPSRPASPRPRPRPTPRPGASASRFASRALAPLRRAQRPTLPSVASGARRCLPCRAPSSSLPPLPEWVHDPASRGWRLLSIPVAVAAVIAALMLIQGGSGDESQTPFADAPRPPRGARPGGEARRRPRRSPGMPASSANRASRSRSPRAGSARARRAAPPSPPSPPTATPTPPSGSSATRTSSFADFEARSLAQLEALAGSASVVERVAAPTPEDTIVRLAADAPKGEAQFEVTLRSAGPYRYYLATTVQPEASATRRRRRADPRLVHPERRGRRRLRCAARSDPLRRPGPRRAAAGPGADRRRLGATPASRVSASLDGCGTSPAAIVCKHRRHAGTRSPAPTATPPASPAPTARSSTTATSAPGGQLLGPLRRQRHLHRHGLRLRDPARLRRARGRGREQRRHRWRRRRRGGRTPRRSARRSTEGDPARPSSAESPAPIPERTAGGAGLRGARASPEPEEPPTSTTAQARPGRRAEEAVVEEPVEPVDPSARLRPPPAPAE